MLSSNAARWPWVLAFAVLLGCGSSAHPGQAGDAPADDAGHDVSADAPSDALADADASAEAGDGASLDSGDADAGSADADATDLDVSADAVEAAVVDGANDVAQELFTRDAAATDADATDASLDGANADAPPTLDAALFSDVFLDALPTGPTPPLSTVDLGGPCAAVENAYPKAPGVHYPVCDVLPPYATNPPSSGAHYPYWAAFREYLSPLPRGYWVHAMEHGAVVFSYHCPAGCDADLAAARALIASLPDDPLCQGMAARLRVVLVPDPDLDVAWAASAWGETLRASCFDPAAFGEFYLSHFGLAPENFCSNGVDFSLPDGGVSVPPGCGVADAGTD